MNQLDKLLRQAKEGEKITIDQHFKQELKKKIMDNGQQEAYFPREKFFWWKRLTIVALPLMVTTVLFFYYYQGEIKSTGPASQEQERTQSAQQDTSSAGVFTNRTLEPGQAPLPSRDTIKTSPPAGISGGATTGISSDAELAAPSETGSAVGVSNTISPQSAKGLSPQKTDPFFFLFGGIILLALCINLLFWYLLKKKR
jgi:cytoskeletal protein RodZ